MPDPEKIMGPSRTWNHPLATGILFLSLALLGWWGGLPERAVLAAVAVFVVVSAAFHPRNGIHFLVLALPFFLGNAKRPYHGWLELFVLATLAAAVAHAAAGRLKVRRTAFALPVLLFLAAGFLSLPVYLKEVYYCLKGGALADSFRAFAGANEGHDLYPLRSLWHLASGAGVFFTAAWTFGDPRENERLLKGVLVIYAVSLFFAFAFRFDWFPHRMNPYLSFQLIGQLGVGSGVTAMSGFAFNSGYWGQYLVSGAALSTYFLFLRSRSPAWFGAAAAAVAVGVSAIPFTYQRGPLLALGGALGCLALVRALRSERPGRVIGLCLAGCVLLAVGLAGIDFAFNGGMLGRRLLGMFRNPSLRDKVWRVAWEIGSSRPILGSGTGTFHRVFPQYCLQAGIPWEGHLRFVRTTAHNVYLHLFAEGGAAGLLCFLGTVGAVFAACLRRVRGAANREAALFTALLAFLGGWLVFGASQNMFYLRIMQVAFWAGLGLLAARFDRDAVPPFSRAGAKITLMILVGAVILLAFRLRLAAGYVPSG
jgi:O-antigen ligase